MRRGRWPSRRAWRSRGSRSQTIWTDDGIALRLPEATEPPPEDLFLVDPDEIERLVDRALGGTALFASRFRENAARALLLPRRRPGERTPLWMQRQRSSDLLAVASRYGSFPIILETYREFLRDVFDLPGAGGGAARDPARARSGWSASRRPRPRRSRRGCCSTTSPTYMYEGDAPLAERRAQALALDRELLAELLGEEELRELLDPAAIADLELELQGLVGGRRVRTVDGMHDLLRRVGDLRTDEVAARADLPDPSRRAVGAGEGPAHRASCGSAASRAGSAIEDVARYRDAARRQPAAGVAETWLASAGDGHDPLDGLLLRWARTHAPFTAARPGGRWGIAAGARRRAAARPGRVRRAGGGIVPARAAPSTSSPIPR